MNTLCEVVYTLAITSQIVIAMKTTSHINSTYTWFHVVYQKPVLPGDTEDTIFLHEAI